MVIGRGAEGEEVRCWDFNSLLRVKLRRAKEGNEVNKDRFSKSSQRFLRWSFVLPLSCQVRAGRAVLAALPATRNPPRFRVLFVNFCSHFLNGGCQPPSRITPKAFARHSPRRTSFGQAERAGVASRELLPDCYFFQMVRRADFASKSAGFFFERADGELGAVVTVVKISLNPMIEAATLFTLRDVHELVQE